MRHHRNKHVVRRDALCARELAMNILEKVDQACAYSNLQLDQSLRETSLRDIDKALVTELVYGTITRLNTIDYFLQRFVLQKWSKIEAWVRALLRISVYQILYLNRIPDHAIVNEGVRLATRCGHRGIASMLNGVLRNMIRNRCQLVVPPQLPFSERVSLEHSHPHWLVKRWISQYGDDTTVAMCEANNIPPTVSVRVNEMHTDRDSLLCDMQRQEVDAYPSHLCEQGIVITSGGHMANTSWYHQGLFSLQDESSMLVAKALSVQPGMNVLDCCAAPGGKTTHIAEQMRNKGKIISNDIHPHKIAFIQNQAKRLGLNCIETTCNDALALRQHYTEASFDRVLLDAPCSGLGVIRRKPDVKWNKGENDIAQMTVLQDKLLESVAPLVKRGGILVYSTCTVEPSENEQRIASFLKKNGQYRLAPLPVPPHSTHPLFLQQFYQTGTIQILPHYAHSDGFYIARLIRIG